MDRKRKQLPVRELIGMVLLLVLLVTGLLVSYGAAGHHQALARDMADAAWYALNQDWDRAGQLTAGSSARWQENWKRWAMVADQRPMTEIDAGFSQLSIYAAARDPVQYAACCRELSRRLQLLADSSRPGWWNLL